MEDLVFVDEDSVKEGVNRVVQAAAERERNDVVNALPLSYRNLLSRVGFCQNQPVYVLSPYQVPLGEHRKKWMQEFVQMRDSNHCDALPYLVYWFKDRSISLESNLMSAQEGEKLMLDMIPKQLQGKFIRQESLSREEKSIMEALRAYTETKNSDEPPFEVPPDYEDFCIGLKDEAAALSKEEEVTNDLPKINQRVSVSWEGDDQYFEGEISKVEHGVFHLIHFDDKQRKWLPLKDHKYHVLPDDAAPKDTQSPLKLPTVMEVAPPPPVIEGPPLLSPRQKTSWDRYKEKESKSDFESELEDISTNSAGPSAVKKKVTLENRPHIDPSRVTEEGFIQPAVEIRRDKHGFWQRPRGREPKNYLWNRRKGVWVQMALELAPKRTSPYAVQAPPQKRAKEVTNNNEDDGRNASPVTKFTETGQASAEARSLLPPAVSTDESSSPVKPQKLMKDLEDCLPFDDSKTERIRGLLEQLDTCDVAFEDVNRNIVMPIRKLKKHPVLGNLAKTLHSKYQRLYCRDLVNSWKNAVDRGDSTTAQEKFEEFSAIKKKNLDDFPGLRDLVDLSLALFDHPELDKLDDELNNKLSKEHV